jgi:hypothetical protein
MKLPVDTSAIAFLCALEPQPVLDFETRRGLGQTPCHPGLGSCHRSGSASVAMPARRCLVELGLYHPRVPFRDRYGHRDQ